MEEIFTLTIQQFTQALPVLLVAILLAEIIRSIAEHRDIKNNFKESEKNIIAVSILGIMTPGPLLAYLPTIKNLTDKGVQASLIAAYISGQTLIGPGRLILEINYFGVTFFLWHVVISLGIAVAVGMTFKLLEKWVKF